MKKYKVKDIGLDVLRTSEGKIATEELFLRDLRLCMMFARYCLDNVTYLEKYESDDTVYEYIRLKFFDLINDFEKIDKCFREHNLNNQLNQKIG